MRIPGTFIPAAPTESSSPSATTTDAPISPTARRSPSPPAQMGGALSQMVAGTVAPMAEQVAEAATEEVTTGLRQRLNAAPSSDTNGKIKLTLRYQQVVNLIDD